MSTLSDFLGCGDDGNCLGCGKPIDVIDPSCPVCLADIETLGEWGLDGVDPDVAGPRLQAAIEASA